MKSERIPIAKRPIEFNSAATVLPRVWVKESELERADLGVATSSKYCKEVPVGAAVTTQDALSQSAANIIEVLDFLVAVSNVAK
jgi:hypothetical protein